MLVIAILLTLLALASFVVVDRANGRPFVSSAVELPHLHWFVLLAAIAFWFAWAFG